MPSSDRAPDIETVTIKAFKPTAGLSQETLAFSASIYINRRRVGRVRNHGHGGPNTYEFGDRPTRDAFLAYARAWGKDNGEPREPQDALIAQLCEDYDYRHSARGAIAAGATTLLVIYKRPVWRPGRARTERPSYYLQSYALAIRGEEDPASVAERHGAATWRLVPIETA